MERPRPLSRLKRVALSTSGVFLVVSMTGCGIGEPVRTTNTPPTRPGIETQEPLSTDELILREAQKLNLNVSERERAREIRLWTKNSDSYPFDPTTSDYYTLEEGARKTLVRIGSTAILMGQSLNEDFRDAQDYLGNLVSEDKLRLFAKMDETGSSYGFDQGFDQNGQFKASLYMDINFALNESDSLIMAGQLTNIAESLRSGFAIASSIPSDLTSDEKNRMFAQDYLSSDIEAEAYGTEARAYIKQVGILGYVYTIPTSGMEERALNYIKTGSNPKSKKWKQYINDILNPKPNPQVS